MKSTNISFPSIIIVSALLLTTGTSQNMNNSIYELDKILSKDFIVIQGVSVEEKANGMIIRIISNEEFLPGQITAWSSESGWFYITLLRAKIDTIIKWPFIKTGFILDYQVQQLKESVQLSFKLNREIGTYEVMIYAKEVLITLRLPLTETVAVIQKYSDIHSEELSTGTKESESSFGERIPNVLLLTGTAFAVVGLIEPSSPSFIFGSALIITGYIMKKTVK